MKDYEVLEGIKKNQGNVIDAAYNKGYSQGFIDGRYSAELIDELKEQEYKRGLHDAWEVTRKIADMDAKTFESIFDSYLCWTNVFSSESASEAIEKIREYEEKQKDEEIKVGDEVMYGSDKGVVTLTANTGNTFTVLGYDGGWIIRTSKENLKKTGRHFSEIEAVLKQMQKG